MEFATTIATATVVIASIWFFTNPKHITLRKPPKSTFRSWFAGDSSVFGVDGFIAALSVGVFLTVRLSWLMGCRCFRILIFSFQAAVRAIASTRQSVRFACHVVDQVVKRNCRRVASACANQVFEECLFL